jgi:hypothetical protein
VESNLLVQRNEIKHAKPKTLKSAIKEDNGRNAKDTAFEIKQKRCSSSNLFIYFQQFIYLFSRIYLFIKVKKK